ncbi:hypothetical protein L1987_43708 [Smallanthus sonchifolius]|uniref:Uncharacterized protein n=1 Tax=Smallanthus sonchifolius TaxID=185202 RepID=A0ACB9GNE1_9ASTR|nr:hypothetical protein L1987_43708 [Smallanthus sonchifolius]
MIDDKEITGGHGWESNCSLVLKIEAVDSDKYTSAEGLRIYSRSKRRKMSNSDEMMKSGFNDKNKAADGSAFDRYVHRLSFGAFSNGPGECSLRNCSNVVLQQTHQSVNGHEGCIQNALVVYPESGPTPVVKESVDNVEKSDNRTHDSAKKLALVLSSDLLKQSEGSTNSELCGRALSDTLNSEKFSELCGLLLKNFGVVNDNRVLDVDALSLKLKNGAYETSPMLYLNDIQQACTKLQEVGNEMVTLAKSLSDISRAHYKQCVRKPRTAEACGCQGCGKKTDVKNCLVCDSCEDIYHLSCTELVATPIPPKSWYCASCVSHGIVSPHDGCIVCEKLKSAASIPLVTGVPTNNQSQDVPDGLDELLHNDVTDESQSSIICFICKSEVKMGDNFRKCGHSLCAHEYYHYKCLTNKQLGVYGPYWYCPSCLCRRCLVDKDDDQIVLCDGCDQAYHIYCASPQLDSIPEGNWFCGKCDRGLKRIRTMRRVYENMQKKVKIEDESEKDEHEAPVAELEGIDMLVTAAKTLTH